MNQNNVACRIPVESQWASLQNLNKILNQSFYTPYNPIIKFHRILHRIQEESMQNSPCILTEFPSESRWNSFQEPSRNPYRIHRCPSNSVYNACSTLYWFHHRIRIEPQQNPHKNPERFVMNSLQNSLQKSLYDPDGSSCISI